MYVAMTCCEEDIVSRMQRLCVSKANLLLILFSFSFRCGVPSCYVIFPVECIDENVQKEFH